MKMKNLSILVSFVLILVGFVACSSDDNSTTKTTLVTFEDVELNDEGYWNGSDETGRFVSENCEFMNTFTDWGWGMTSWMGFACSNQNQTEIEELNYDNYSDLQYNVAAGSGVNNSKKFALIYESNAIMFCPTNVHGYYTAKSIMLTNSTLTAHVLKNGYGTATAFKAGDWFKVTIKGYKRNIETGSVDYYLADFRDGKSFIATSWNKVNISSLGEVDKIIFDFDSTDKTTTETYEWLNTPSYVCIDNIEFIQEIKD